MNTLLKKQSPDDEAKELQVCYERSKVFLQKIIHEKLALLNYEASIREQIEPGMYCPTYYAFYEHKRHKEENKTYPIFKWKLTSDDELEAIEECMDRILGQLRSYHAQNPGQLNTQVEAEELCEKYEWSINFLAVARAQNLVLSEYYPLVTKEYVAEHRLTRYELAYVHQLHTSVASDYVQFKHAEITNDSNLAFRKCMESVINQLKTYKAKH